MTEKRILFSKIISWAPLQATKKKQNPITQPNLLIKGIRKVEQKPDSSALVSFEAGWGNSDLWEFDANSEHLFTVQHYLKQWGWGGGVEAALLQPCPQTVQCSFRTSEFPAQTGAGRLDVDFVWQWEGLMCSHSDVCSLCLLNHRKFIGLTSIANMAILHLSYIPHQQHPYEELICFPFSTED